jgi:hypothetical protein
MSGGLTHTDRYRASSTDQPDAVMDEVQKAINKMLRKPLSINTMQEFEEYQARLLRQSDFTNGLADVHRPKSVVLTQPVVMSDPSYGHKWPEAISSVIERMEKKGIEVDVW